MKVRHEQTDAELGLRLAHDSDPWARWDAGQTLALRALLAGVAAFRRTGRCPAPPEALVQGMAALLDDASADPALLAQALTLPSENWIGRQISPLDPEAVFCARRACWAGLGRALKP